MSTIEVQPYDWSGKDHDGQFMVRIWTHNKDSIRNLIRIEDYHPFCRIELPKIKGGWGNDRLDNYKKWIKDTLNKDGHSPVLIQHGGLQKLYKYQSGTKYLFLVCHFTSEAAMNHCIKLVQSASKRGYPIQGVGIVNAKVHETQVSSLHRMVTDIKLGYGQWFRVKADLVPSLNRISTCEHEYIAKYKDIIPLSAEETSGWIVRPRVAAIDIECYSHNHKSMPNENHVDDVSFQISYIDKQLGNPSSRKKYLLVLGDCNDITDAEIRKFDHEIALIDGLCDLIKETDPSLITGYNIFKFDFKYLNARMKLYMREWKHCGILIDEVTKIKSHTWKSSAYGFVTICMPEIEGRLCIDMYIIIRRDYKLDRYTLDFVCKHFLKRGKHDVTAREMFKIYKASKDAITNRQKSKASKKMAKVGAYCLEDSCLCIDLMEELNTWIMLVELSSIVQVTMMTIFTGGQQKRVFNQVYQFAYNEGFVVDERGEASDGFKGGNVVDPIPGKYRNILIFDFASLYPSIIRAYNICFTTLVSDDSGIPDDQCNIVEWEEDVEVKVPKEPDANGKIKGRGKYTKTMVHNKYRYRFIKETYFKGILPRMCEHLVSERKKTRDKIGPQNDPVTNIVLEQRQNGLKVSANSIFGALGVKEGRLPLPEGARSICAMGRKLQLMAADYVERVHGGKIVYGDTDSIMVDLNITDPADCVTIGKQLSKELTALYSEPLKLEFERALSIALFIKKKKYAGVPLCIAEMGPKCRVTELQFAPEHANPDLRLYHIDNYVIDKKTGEEKLEIKYIGIPKDIDVTNKPIVAGIPLSQDGGPNTKELLKKGVILARRDNCIWIREVYLKILYNILFDKPLKDTLGLLDTEIIGMMSRGVPLIKMMITREIGSNYKPESTYFFKLFIDEMRKQGVKLESGERIDYLFVRCIEEWKNGKQGYKMRLPDMYMMNNEIEPIDTLHYVSKVMKNPIEQIVYLGYKAEIDQNELRCHPQKRKRGKIYTYVKHDYIDIWSKMVKAKEKIVDVIKTAKPHFVKYNEGFWESFGPPELVIAA